MRIAAITDIHGNLEALDVVLAAIGRRGADVIVNLGDVLSGPLQPCETADRLMPLQLPTICGNHERQLMAPDVARMGLSGLKRGFESVNHRAVEDALARSDIEWVALRISTLAVNSIPLWAAQIRAGDASSPSAK